MKLFDENQKTRNALLIIKLLKQNLDLLMGEYQDGNLK